MRASKFSIGVRADDTEGEGSFMMRAREQTESDELRGKVRVQGQR